MFFPRLFSKELLLQNVIRRSHDYIYCARYFLKWKVAIEIVKIIIVCSICLMSMTNDSILIGKRKLARYNTFVIASLDELFYSTKFVSVTKYFDTNISRKCFIAHQNYQNYRLLYFQKSRVKKNLSLCTNTIKRQRNLKNRNPNGNRKE